MLMIVKIISHTPDCERIIAAAAKLCYSDTSVEDLLTELTDEKVEKFISRLSSLGHESPLEHVTFTFAIEGVSRSLLAQLTRHRIASFSVQSQRYVNKENFSCIIPTEIEKLPEAKKEFLAAIEDSRQHYVCLVDLLKECHEQKLLKEGVSLLDARRRSEKLAIEDARSVLPNACDTKIIMTMNVRSLFNFFKLRCCERAQKEIHLLADEILRQVKQVSPFLFRNAGPPCLKGGCSEGKMSCGKIQEVREKYQNFNMV